VTENGEHFIEMRYPTPSNVPDVTLAPESSADLTDWTAEGFELTTVGDETVAKLPFPEESSQSSYLRLRANLKP
ncbi:MAG: hypothetical protein ACKVHP_06730, partial [Verrucomicrobiales bacterium]